MPPKSKKAPVADSWEDESSSESEPEPTTKPIAMGKSQSRSGGSEEEEEEDDDEYIAKRLQAASLRESRDGGRLSPPPPPPPSQSSSLGTTPRSGLGDDGERRRPEKTDAVARRLIAGALGVRVKTTAEQREFDKALREKEKKRKEEERRRAREEEERKERAKKGVWEDD